jgi:hypothetical protein
MLHVRICEIDRVVQSTEMKNSTGGKEKTGASASKMATLGRRLSAMRSPVASPSMKIAATPKTATPRSAGGVIVNELLCFVCNKLDILTHDTIVKLCGDAFSDPEIEDSKTILFDLCAKDRMIKRRGVDMKKNNLNDILNLLHGLEPAVIPCFAAVELSKLPPIYYNHMDMSVILKELDSVKSDIAELKVAQTATLEICRDQPIHKAAVSNKLGEKMKDMPDTNATDMESSETDSIIGMTGLGDVIIDAHQTGGRQGASIAGTNDGELGGGGSNDPPVITAKPPADTDDDVTEKEEGELDDSITELKQLLSPTRPRVTQLKTNDVTSFAVMARELSVHGLAAKQLNAIKTTYDVFTTVAPRRKKAMVIGTGSSTALRGVNYTQRPSTTAAFITRLSPGTTEADMCDYVRSCFGIDTRCEQLQTRYDSYASFNVVVNGKYVDKILDPVMWPAGVMFRKNVVAKSAR